MVRLGLCEQQVLSSFMYYMYPAIHYLSTCLHRNQSSADKLFILPAHPSVCPYTHICSRAVATGPVGPVSTGPLSGTLSHVFVVNQRLMTARTSFKASLPSLPDTPHHLKDVAFPKRTFRKSKPVLCSAWSQWFSTWPFLHYV